LNAKKAQKTIPIKHRSFKDWLGLLAIPLAGMKTAQNRREERMMNFFSAVASERATDLLLSIPAALWR
jgi:hypothetical protein